MSTEHYFLGSATETGFFTPVKELLDDKSGTVYILKGTAGSGKSTLMKKISTAFENEEQEIFHCSADPFSLDGVYLKERRAMIIDGTAPHCFDPVYPKAVESIIDLGALLETQKLRNARNEIISLTDEYAGCHKRCRICLSAVSSVITDILAAGEEAVLTEKICSFADKLIKKLVPAKKDKAVRGKTYSRQLSAITMNGYFTYIPENYKIYLLSDDLTAGSALFLKEAAEKITDKGYDIYISPCLLSSERFFEHILIPELKLAFISSNCINTLSVPSAEKNISFKRFYDSEALDEQVRQRFKFGRKACTEFIKEASAALTNAKLVHDKIEEFYIDAADFDGLNRTAYKLISDIKSL